MAETIRTKESVMEKVDLALSLWEKTKNTLAKDLSEKVEKISLKELKNIKQLGGLLKDETFLQTLENDYQETLAQIDEIYEEVKEAENAAKKAEEITNAEWWLTNNLNQISDLLADSKIKEAYSYFVDNLMTLEIDATLVYGKNDLESAFLTVEKLYREDKIDEIKKILETVIQLYLPKKVENNTNVNTENSNKESNNKASFSKEFKNDNYTCTLDVEGIDENGWELTIKEKKFFYDWDQWTILIRMEDQKVTITGNINSPDLKIKMSIIDKDRGKIEYSISEWELKKEGDTSELIFVSENGFHLSNNEMNIEWDNNRSIQHNTSNTSNKMNVKWNNNINIQWGSFGGNITIW